MSLHTRVVVSLGTSVYDNEISRKVVTVKRLFDNLSKFQVRPKKDGKYFIFAEFEGNRRNAASVKKYYGATLDADYGDPSPKTIKRALKHLNCAYVIYSTHSHMDPHKGRRYRVVVPYSRPVNPDEHIRTTVFLNHLLGGDLADTSSKALSRPMFLPSVHPSRESTKFYYKSSNRRLLDVDSEIELPPEIQFEIDQALIDDPKDKLDILEEVSEGGRNDHLARVAGTLINQGKTLADVFEYCLEVNDLKFSPPLSDSEVRTVVNSVWKSHARNHGDTDWGYEQIRDMLKDKDAEAISDSVDQIVETIALSIHRGKTSRLQAESLFKDIKKINKTIAVTALREDLKQKLLFARNDDRREIMASSPDDLDSTIVEVRQQYKDYYFLACDNKLFNRINGQDYKLEGFNNDNQHVKADFGFSPLTPFRLLKEVGCFETIDAVDYHPGKDLIFKSFDNKKCLNIFRPNDLLAEENYDRNFVLQYFRYLIPNRFYRTILLDFIAYMVQNPGHKIRWMPILVGPKGVGKSIIFDFILSRVFGYHNLNPINNTDQIVRRIGGANPFNAWQTGAQTVFIHELWADSFETRKLISETMKSFITDSYIHVNPKFGRDFKTENYANVMAMSNHDDCVYVTADERRFCMLRSRNNKDIIKIKKFIKLSKLYPEYVMWYFQERKIENFDPDQMPMTDFTLETMESSYNWCESAIYTLTSDDRSPLHYLKVMSYQSICDVVVKFVGSVGRSRAKYEDVYNGSTSSGRLLKQALRNFGFMEYRGKDGQIRRCRVDGEYQTLWITPYGVKHRFQNVTLGIAKKEAQKFISEAQTDFYSEAN